MWVKICGVTTVSDAVRVVELGANAVGVNLVPASPRFVDATMARDIARAVRELGASAVGVVADRSAADLVELRERLGLSALQLHGAETADTVRELLPDAYKAVRIGSAEDVAGARAWPGTLLLVDSKSPDKGALGGTGTVFDWALVRDLCRARPIVLAGGLTPKNVDSAVRDVGPWGVDVASGVEVPGNPRAKDMDRVREFVRRARAA